MGLGDKVKQHAEEKLKHRSESARRGQGERDLAKRKRQELFAEVQKTCPLPVKPDQRNLPGGLALFDDEFLVALTKDWGWSSKKLVLTTHRVIYSRGRALSSKDQQVAYLGDIRDVRFHKPLMRHGSITLETAGGHSVEGLPAAQNGARVRNHLLALVHWARNRAQESQPAPATRQAPLEPTVPERLRNLAELHASGVLTAEEFNAKKQELLSLL